MKTQELVLRNKLKFATINERFHREELCKFEDVIKKIKQKLSELEK